MSTFAITLAAWVAVGGDSEPLPAHRQALDLQGKWVGTGEGDNTAVWKVMLLPGVFELRDEDGLFLSERWEVTDEGGGKFHFRLVSSGSFKLVGGKTCLGVYRQEGDSLTLCFREPGLVEGRPTAFRVEKGQRLLTLHRVKLGRFDLLRWRLDHWRRDCLTEIRENVRLSFRQ